MMGLRAKQSKFLRLTLKLMAWGHRHGYEFTYGEALRTKAQAKINSRAGTGIVNSLHRLKLAIDLNVFKRGKWLNKTEQLTALGEYWESLDKECAWGGRFKYYYRKGIRRGGPDGNHFSLAHNGRK